MELKDSQTFQNLQKAFEEELISSSTYRLYGALAGREGYIQIKNIFDKTSHQQIEHARIWLRILNNGELPSTETNLNDASVNSAFPMTALYNQYSQTAREEGFTEIATLFDGVANIEREYDGRFRAEFQNIQSGQLFCKPAEVIWVCLNCGNLLYGNCAPEICPVCFFPQGYYAIYCVTE